MSEISKTIRTYRIDGNPQADVLYDVFAMWADEVAALEAQVEALLGIMRKARPHIRGLAFFGDEYQRHWPDDEGFDEMLAEYDALLEGKDGE